MRCGKKDLLLYAVTDRSWLNGETLYSQVEKALKGGATFVQLREKALDQEAFLTEAKEIQALCRQYKVPFVINDNVDIAVAVDADGVHVGQSDMEAERVREKLGPDKILGVSAQTVEQAVRAERKGADYLGVGAVFHTGSKADADDVSHETLTAICESVKIPVIAIGGINRDNVTLLKGSGICGIAAISALFAQPDIERAASELKELTDRMVNGMIAGAIFDIDGTLLDSMPIWEHAGERYLGSLGIEAEPGLGRLMLPMSMLQGAEYLKERYGLRFDTDEIIDGINNTIQGFYDNQVQLKHGVKQFLDDMKKCGIKMTAATSSDRSLIEKAMDRLEILNLFDRVFTCSEVGAGKSKPDIYLAAKQFMDTEISDTWVFEDAYHAIQTAKNAGFRTVGVYDASSMDAENEIRKFSDIYLYDLADFNAFIEMANRRRDL